MDSKTCRACGAVKPLSEFRHNHQTEDKLMYDCAVCYSARHGKAIRIRREPDPPGWRTCTRCGERKPADTEHFHRNVDLKGGLANWCKPCLRAAQRVKLNTRPDLKRDQDKRRYERYADRIKDGVRLNRRERAARNRQWVDDYLAAHPCVDCGEPDTRCLHFDHRNGEDKETNVANLLSKVATLVRIEEEVARCDVRCANCHFKRHNRNRWKEHTGWVNGRAIVLKASE